MVIIYYGMVGLVLWYLCIKVYCLKNVVGIVDGVVEWFNKEEVMKVDFFMYDLKIFVSF